MHDKWLLVIKFANQQKIWPLTEQKNSGDQFCHISNCVRVSKLSENTCRLTLCPPSPWSIFVHVSLVNGWRPLMRIILVSGLLYQRTLFSSPRACPLTRELTVSRNCTQNPKTVKKCVWNTIVTSNLSRDLKWKWEHFLNELVCSFYFLRLFFIFAHRLWQGIVFIVINDLQKKTFLSFVSSVCFFLFWSNGGTNCSYLSYYKAVNWYRWRMGKRTFQKKRREKRIYIQQSSCTVPQFLSSVLNNHL